jgi:hypothetical protein
MRNNNNALMSNNYGRLQALLLVIKIPVGTRFTAFWRSWYHIYLEQVKVRHMMQSSFGKQTQDGRGPDAGTWQHLANCRPPAAACDTSMALVQVCEVLVSIGETE